MNRARWFTPLLALLLIAATPTVSTADSKGYYGCTSSDSSALHMTATRIRYTSGGSAVYASATQSYKQVLAWKPDVTWTFHHFESAGFQTRYTQPTQWGSASSPTPNVAIWVDVYWHGRNSGGNTGYRALCRTTVGR
jgi:hypothetical protein